MSCNCCIFLSKHNEVLAVVEKKYQTVAVDDTELYYDSTYRAVIQFILDFIFIGARAFT